jgi:hypothetical protein
MMGEVQSQDSQDRSFPFFCKDQPRHRLTADTVATQQDMDFDEQDALVKCFCQE